MGGGVGNGLIRGKERVDGRLTEEEVFHKCPSKVIFVFLNRLSQLVDKHALHILKRISILKPPP